MSSLVTGTATYALNALWEIPLIATAGWASSWLLRGWGARPQHRVWVAALLLGAIAPALTIWQSVLPLAIFSHGGAAASVPLAGGTAQAAARGAVGWVLPHWLLLLLFGAYASGLAYFATRLLWKFACAGRMLGASAELHLDGEAAARWAQIRGKYSCRRVRLRLAATSQALATVGASKPAILVPQGFLEESTADEFLSAMGHELAHIERRDYAKNLLYELVSLAVNFHPVVWMVKRQIIQSREMICDAIVSERLVSRKVYRQSLLRLAARMMEKQSGGIFAVGIFDANILEKRIMAMKSKRQVPCGFVRVGLTIGAAVLLAGALATTSALAKNVKTPTKDNTAKWGVVENIGKGVKAPVALFAPEPKSPKGVSTAKAKHGIICDLGVIVDRKGKTEDVHVMKSGGKAFDAQAIKAVRQYRFRPATKDGKPVAVRMVIEVEFRKF